MMSLALGIRKAAKQCRQFTVAMSDPVLSGAQGQG